MSKIEPPPYLTPAQQAVASSTAKNTLVIAGPGAGKTSVALARVTWLLHQPNITPEQIVMITYSNAAATEIKERWFGSKISFIGTIHAWVLRMLNRREEAKGRAPWSVLTQAQTEDLVREVIADLRVKVSEKACFKSIKAGPLWNASPKDHINGVDLVNFETYARMLRDKMLSFDGILHMGLLHSAELLQEGDWFHLLVDEYQDVSPLIHRLLLMVPMATQFYVGDPDQAVFSFAGGSITGIMELSRSPDWTLFKLEDNFRCGQAICRVANRLISHNAYRVAKLSVPATGEPGMVAIEWDRPSLAAERQMIAAYLSELPPNTTAAVLCRTHFLCERMVEALEGFGLTVATAKPVPMPADWELACAYVGFLANPDNDYLAFRVLVMLEGQPAAVALRQTAWTWGSNLNTHHFKVGGAELSDVVTLLARAKISQVSITCVTALAPNVGNLQELALAMADAQWTVEKTDGIVEVLTLHSAKGREFDWVFIPHVAEPRKPEKPWEQEESRRLLFVGMTRARHKLVLSCGRAGQLEPWDRDPHGVVTPSKFLEEVR